MEVPLADRSARQVDLPPSEVLRREVYTKVLKGETMVRKFVVWRTNKEDESDEYPAFVLHYTDFSPNRKQPFAREVRVSNSSEQIQQLCDGLKEANIKKGWELSAVMEVPVAEQSTPSEVAIKNKVAKKAGGAAPTAEKPAKTTAAKKKLAPSEPTRKKKTKKKSG